MAKQRTALIARTYRISAKQDEKVKRAAAKRNQGEGEIIRELIDTLP